MVGPSPSPRLRWKSAFLTFDALSMSANWGETAKMKLDGPAEESGRLQGRAPGGVSLVGDDQIDAPRFQKVSGGDLGRPGCRRQGEAIDQRAEPHVAKLFVAGELRIQENDPADGHELRRVTLRRMSLRLAGWVKDLQGSKIPHGARPYCLLADVPERVGPFREVGDALGVDGRVLDRAAWRQTALLPF